MYRATQMAVSLDRYSEHCLHASCRDQMRCWQQIADNNAELRQQQNLYEAVRSDRNLYSKNLIAAQDEILDLKRKFKILVRAFQSPAMHRADSPLADPVVPLPARAL